MKKILITGSAGFIGSHLVDFLLSKNFKVVGFDNLITGSEENFSHNIGSRNFLFVKHNVTEYLYLEGKVDFVLHLASPASPVDYLKYPIQTLKVGSLGTHKALGFAKEKKAKFLLASTSEVYGDPAFSPQNESYWGNVNPVGVRGVYDEAKRFAEAMTMAYFRFHKLKASIARIFNTYGPRMRLNDGRIIPNFVYQALRGEHLTVYGDGQQTRSFCYVSDLVEGLFKLMISNVCEPVNLGNPDERPVLEVAEYIIKKTKSKSKIKFLPLPEDDPKQRKPDITRAKKFLNWQPTISFEEGLEKTIKWFKKKM